MEFALIVWAIGVLPALGHPLSSIGFITTVFILAAKSICKIEGHEIKCLRYLFLSIPIWIVGAITPDKETAYAMAAAYGIQSVVQDDRVQKIAGQGVDVLEAYLEKTKKELEK